MTDSPLVLGPLVRYVDETSASVWVETRDAARVTVRVDGSSWSARTFRVHGHHYALVVVDGLAPGSVSPYSVEVDDDAVWPPTGAAEGADYPRSVIATLEPGKPLRMAFGSCRTSVDHGAGGNATHGVDALRSLALRMATDDTARWPDLVLFLGDQVYADETTAEMQDFIEARRDIDEPPGKELKDYEEYAHLYALAWNDPLNRWLLSTLPSLMIFDDHDVRDDWNTSYSWQQDIRQTSWWHERIVSGLASYWVYQHVGNLSPDERAEDPVWQRIVAHAEGGGDDELDLTQALDDLAERVDEDPDDVPVELRPRRSPASGSSWWTPAPRGSSSRTGARCSTTTSSPGSTARCAAACSTCSSVRRCRSCCRPGCTTWRRGTRPSATARGARGPRRTARSCVAPWTSSTGARSSTRSTRWRRWPRRSPTAAGARRRRPSRSCPATCTTPTSPRWTAPHWAGSSRIIQAVCSPIRNPLPRKMRFATAVLAYAVAGPVGKLVAALRQGAERAVPLAQHRRPVVRQQHRRARGPRRRPRRAVAHRCRRG